MVKLLKLKTFDFNLKKMFSVHNLEPEGQQHGIIMGVLLLGLFYYKALLGAMKLWDPILKVFPDLIIRLVADPCLWSKGVSRPESLDQEILSCYLYFIKIKEVWEGHKIWKDISFSQCNIKSKREIFSKEPAA